MSLSPRSEARGRMLRRLLLIAGALVLLTLLFAASGHWILAVVFGVPAVVVSWVLLQARSVR
jgi:hypothetical protein